MRIPGSLASAGIRGSPVQAGIQAQGYPGTPGIQDIPARPGIPGLPAHPASPEYQGIRVIQAPPVSADTPGSLVSVGTLVILALKESKPGQDSGLITLTIQT